MRATTTPRIYVACLASYNAGKPHGAWIDANQSTDAIRDAIAEMLKESPETGVAEEWAIHDFEGFAGIKLSESHDIDEVADLAELIEEHDADVVSAAADVTDGSDADSLKETLERYRGVYSNPEDYAAEVCEECGMIPKDLPELIAGHIDWQGVARDMELGGDVSFIRKGGSVYVFDNNA